MLFQVLLLKIEEEAFINEIGLINFYLFHFMLIKMLQPN